MTLQPEDLKRILPLYIGCQVRIARPSGLSIETFTAARLHELQTLLTKSWDLHKPILWPLDSISDEDVTELIPWKNKINGIKMLNRNFEIK